MALVGSLSGSGGVSNTIGITGSLIIANPGLGSFPIFPGDDVTLFVSGNIANKPATSPNYSVRGTTVFGGDVVISGTLFGGSPLYIGSPISASAGIAFSGGAATFSSGLSGSLTRLTDGTSYLIAGTNVSIVTGTNGAITISATAGGGGGSNFFLDTAGAGKIYTTASSVAFPFGEAGIDEAADKGTDVVFYVSGSASGTATSLFTGNIVTSGSIKVAGNITGDNTTARTIFSDVTDITIGGASSTVTVAGDLQVTGNDVKMSGGTTALTFSGTGDVAVAGDLTVTGNDIKASGGTTAITLTGADVAIAGDLTVTGNDIKSSTATALTLAGANVTTAGNLTVTGDLTVNGTTTTIDTTNLLVEDPIILMASGAAGPNRNGGIAIFSGSADVTAVGARSELVFGRVANDTWGAGKFNTNNGTSTDLTGMSLLPVRASKFEVGGTTAFVTSSLGTNILAQASTATTLKTTAGDVNLDAGTGAGVDILFNGTQAGAFTGTGATVLNLFARDGIAGSVARSLVLSGSDVTIGAHSTVTNFSFAGNNSGLVSSTNGFTLASTLGTDLNLSGSNNFRIRHGSSGVAFQQHGLPYLSIVSGSNALSTNLALITGTPGKDLLVGGSSLAILSGSEVFLDAGANGVNVRRDSSTFLSFSSGSTNALTISTPISTTANLLNTTVTSLNIGGAATAIEIGAATGTTSINHVLTVDGNTVLGSSSSSKITFTGQAASNLVPDTNNAYDLGQPNLRWRNMYTGDLHLRNERGDWTIIEEEEFLTITNNKNGKRYKFCLEEI